MKSILTLSAIAGVAALSLSGLAHAERAVPIPAVARDVPAQKGMQTAILAGGCFWGMEAVFENVKGVRDVVNGYAGGTKADATYARVSTEKTGHAEAVRITFDPNVVSYGTLLRVYFSIAHNPTELNRQGPDSGPSYRSAIFPQNAAQRTVAQSYIAQLGKTGAFGKPIVTKIEGGAFYPAESYHQNFFDRNPNHPYIVAWDKPKVAAFKAGFPKLVG